MNKEAGWVAAMLAVLLVLLALFPPVRAGGQLPELGERPAEVDCRVPLICLGAGRIVGQVQRLMARATWQLETIPME
jgi:hypothetical protein